MLEHVSKVRGTEAPRSCSIDFRIQPLADDTGNPTLLAQASR